jgi:hypothetical protein
MAANESKTRTDVLQQFQSQIDALDQGAAAARANITARFAPIAAGRMGSTAGAQARGGNLGSTVGYQALDEQTNANTADLNGQIQQSDQMFANQRANLMQFIAGEADKENALRQAASTTGADNKIQEIQDRPARQQASALASVKAMLAAGVTDPSNPNYSDSINKIATNTGLTKDQVTSLYSDTKQTADAAALKAQTDAATLAGTQAGTAKTTAETAQIPITAAAAAAAATEKARLDNSTIAKNYQDIATAKASMPGAVSPANLPQVNMTAGNIPDPTAQSKLLSSIPDSNLQALIQGIADYKINPNSLPTRNYKGVGGLTQSQVLSLVSQYDPTFSQSQYASRQALQTNFTSGKYSQNINALNTAVGHISDILNNTKDLGNTSVPGVNAVKNFIASGLGSGAVAKATTNLHAATGELASVFKSGGATDQEISNLGTIDANSSPSQVQAYIETASQLLASRLQALTDTYTSGMGKAPATGFLSPTSQANLQKLSAAGLNIQVPGVNNSSATPSVGDSVNDASGVSDGTTAQGSDGKNYVAQGGQWVAQ